MGLINDLTGISTEDVQKLKDDWEEKLKAEGLGVDDDYQLQKQEFRKHNHHAKSELYYKLIAKLIEEHEFKSERNKQIMILHQQGQSLRKIGKQFDMAHSHVDQTIKSEINRFNYSKQT